MAETDDIVARLKAIHLAAEIERLRTTLTAQAAEIERLTRERSKVDHALAEAFARATTAERERDEARAEVERKDAALLRIAKRCRRPDLVARAALEEEGKT